MAANPDQQETDLTIGKGDDAKVYTLKATSRACRMLEKRTGKTTGELMGQVAKVSIDTFVELLQASLQKYHAAEFPYTPKGEAAVENLMDDAGGWRKLVPVFVELLGVKDDKDKALAEDGPNPTEAQAGTGDDSTLKLVASA